MEICGFSGKVKRGVCVSGVTWYLLFPAIEKLHSVFSSGGTLCGLSLCETYCFLVWLNYMLIVECTMVICYGDLSIGVPASLRSFV